MNRIVTFMALSVWLAFGLAFKLVSDAANVIANAPEMHAATPADSLEAKRKRVEATQNRRQVDDHFRVAERVAADKLIARNE